MKFFWPVFFLVALGGSAAIYWGAPRLQPHLPGNLGPRVHAVREQLNRNVSQLKAQTLADVADPDIAQPPLSDAEIASLEERAGVKKPSRPQLQEEEPEEELAPILHNITIAGKNDKPYWGVIRKPTAIYNTDGAKVGVAPSGTLLLFHQIHNSANNGAMVQGLLLDEKLPSTPVLVRRSEALLFTGDYTKLSDRQLNAVREYYSLNGKVFLRDQKLNQEAAHQNPFFTEYQAKAKGLMAHEERAKALVVERDRATGPRRAAIEDQLRNAKLREVALQQEYKAIHTKYLAWKEQNSDKQVRTQDDDQIKEWQLQKRKLARFIPGLAF